MSSSRYVCYTFVFYSDLYLSFFFFFKQKTAYEMRISDWSSDVCSSDLRFALFLAEPEAVAIGFHVGRERFAVSGIVERVAHAVERIASHRHAKIGRASCRERVCQYV